MVKVPLWEESTGALAALINAGQFVSANLYSFASNASDEFRPHQVSGMLSENATIAWNPDSSDIIIWNTDDVYQRVSADGAGPTTFYDPIADGIAPGEGLQYSPDGATVAFVGNVVAGDGIWTINADGTGLAQIYAETPPEGIFGLSWGANDKLIFVRPITGEIWQIDSNGSNLTQITSGLTVNPDRPQWSTDCSKIAFLGSGTSSPFPVEIWTVNADGSSATQLTSFQPEGVVQQGAWSIDDSKIIFTANANSSNTISGNGLWLMNSDGSNQHKFCTTLGKNPIDVQFSPDGNRVAYGCVIAGATPGFDTGHYGLWTFTTALSLKLRENLPVT